MIGACLSAVHFTLLYVNFSFVVFIFHSFHDWFLFCLIMFISHVRKEMSYSNWLLVCKVKTNA